ncbi:MAG: ATP-binding protein [Ahniella sp.]|nr:ATP-binding protein [Ahniella sp.]
MNDAILSPIEAALRLSPDNPPLLDAYVQAALGAALPGRLVAVLGELALEPNRLTAALRLKIGNALIEDGLLERALHWLPDDSAEALLVRARVLLALDQRPAARETWTRARELAPGIDDGGLGASLDERVVSIASARKATEKLQTNIPPASGGDDVVRLFQPKQQRITFADVGGLAEVKAQIRKRIITPFQKPSLFQRFSRKAGGGVLMYGPPGCGKTLLARATAGECSASFFNVAVSDVLDLYIGESERKLRAVFDQARRAKPAVLFFDEVEALGGKRQYSRESGTAKLVSQFLSELDGFERNNEGVLILAATNVPWAVDPAFRRPGRFDRVLFVPPPDQEAREDILRGLLKGRPVAGTIDTGFIARQTGGFSGADLTHLVDEAVDQAIEASMQQGEDVPLTDPMLKSALKDTKPTTLEWLTTARNYARYANEAGQYDEVLAFLDRHGQR